MLPAANFADWDPLSPSTEPGLHIRTSPLISSSPMADAPGLNKADRVVQRYKQAIRARDIRIAELQAQVQVRCCSLTGLLVRCEPAGLPDYHVHAAHIRHTSTPFCCWPPAEATCAPCASMPC